MGLFGKSKNLFSRAVDVIDKNGNKKSIIVESPERAYLEDENIEKYIKITRGEEVKLIKKTSRENSSQSLLDLL